MLAPEASLSNVMESGFFAEKLMQKRHLLYRGGSPSMTLGGAFKVNLNKERKFNINPSFSSIVLNPVVVFDQSTLLIFSFRQGERQKGLKNKSNTQTTNSQVERRFELEKYALIFGNAHSNSAYTRLGSVRLPFKLYAALGKFNTAFLNYTSEGLFASYTEKVGYRVAEGCSVGVNTDGGIYGVSFVLNIPQNRFAVRDANLSAVIYQPLFNVTVGGTYTAHYNDARNPGGGVHFGLGISSVKAHLEVLWPLSENSKRESKYYTTHGEVIWNVPISQYPLTIVGGYSDSRRTRLSSFFVSAKTNISRYSKLGFGVEVPMGVEDGKRSVRDRDKFSRSSRYLAQYEFSF